MLDLAELPETYGRDEVTLLSRDPSWYFVYWEVTEAGQQAAAEQLGSASANAKLVLRLFLTTTAGREHRDRERRGIPVPGDGRAAVREQQTEHPPDRVRQQPAAGRPAPAA